MSPFVGLSNSLYSIPLHSLNPDNFVYLYLSPIEIENDRYGGSEREREKEREKFVFTTVELRSAHKCTLNFKTLNNVKLKL